MMIKNVLLKIKIYRNLKSKDVQLKTLSCVKLFKYSATFSINHISMSSMEMIFLEIA